MGEVGVAHTHIRSEERVEVLFVDVVRSHGDGCGRGYLVCWRGERVEMRESRKLRPTERPFRFVCTSVR